MVRALPLLLFVAFLAVGGLWLWWHLAYGLEGDLPETPAITGLSAPIRLTWEDDDFVLGEAANEADAYAALGFAHGVRQPWTLVHLRQAAEGRLSEWYGEQTLPIDRLARRLGFARIGRASFDLLSEEEQAVLTAYTAGLNEALLHPAVLNDEAFVLQNVKPTPWMPWHTLALERLYAWLATPQIVPDSLDGADANVRAFADADRALRTWLRLHGFEHSIAWTHRDAEGTLLVQRHVYGATARSPFVEVTLRVGPNRWMEGASLPGTPFFPAGKSAARSWALLLGGEVTPVRVAADSALGPVHYERLILPDGSEALARYHRTETLFALTPEGKAPLPDTVWALQWPGMALGSDLGAWRSLPTAAAPAFRLLTGEGLLVTPDGNTQVLGASPYRVAFTNGQLIGRTPWVASLGARLDSLSRTEAESTAVEMWVSDPFSPWAARLAPNLVASAERQSPTDSLTIEALTYLRNWDYEYDRTSIAAVLFDDWAQAYRDSTGALPTVQTAPDSLARAEDHLRMAVLQKRIARLAAHQGSDVRQWRWESIHADHRYYPPWPLADSAATSAHPFASLEKAGQGHPSTLLWGASPVGPALDAPAAWEAWTRADRAAPFVIRRRHFVPTRFLDRYLRSNEAPAPVALP